MLLTQTTLGNVSKGGKGNYGIAASAVDYSDELYTYLRITDIKDDGTIDFGGLKSVNDEKAANYLLQPNDIVFARTGASTGRNYFYDGSDGQFVYAGFLIKFSIDPDKVNPKYVKYYCLSQEYKGWIASYNTGSTRGNINAKTLAQMPLVLPERMQQDKMVDILSSIERKIKENEKINKNLEQQAQAVYNKMFSEVNSEPVELSSIIDVRDGTHDSPKVQTMGYYLITSKHLLSFGVDKASANHISKADFDKINERSLVETKDILMSMIGTIGLISYIPYEAIDFAIKNVALFKTSHTPELAYYFLCYLKSERTLQHIEKRLAGSTQKYISLGELRKMPIYSPTTDEIREFNCLVKPMFEEIVSRTYENTLLAEMRDTLLPKLMSGELDVSNIEL